MHIVEFPEHNKKDLSNLCDQIHELFTTQPYELNMAEVIGVLEIVKSTFLYENLHDED